MEIENKQILDETESRSGKFCLELFNQETLSSHRLRKIYSNGFHPMTDAASVNQLTRQLAQIALKFAIHLALIDRHESELVCQIISDAETAYG